MVTFLVMGLKKNKLQIWQHVHIVVHKEMIAVHLSFHALKRCANFSLSVFQTILHLKIIDFARNVSTTYLTVGVLLSTYLKNVCSMDVSANTTIVATLCSKIWKVTHSNLPRNCPYEWTQWLLFRFIIIYLEKLPASLHHILYVANVNVQLM